MFQSLYQTLNSIGYQHPIHPTITHLTVGMVMGAFIFGIAAWILRKPSISQAARYCVVLALISAIPTAVLGYADWRHFFGGGWIPPIRWKLILAPTLFVLLFIAWLSGRKTESTSFGHVVIYFLCLSVVTVIGYFGGELVYGKNEVDMEKAKSEQERKGGEIFSGKCLLCHHTDSTEKKIGPGLKGLFERNKLPVSKKPVNGRNIKEQITNPYRNMPSFEELNDNELDALVAYIKTL